MSQKPLILFEDLFGKTSTTTILSHFVSNYALPYTVIELQEILDIPTCTEINEIVQKFVQDHILFNFGTDTPQKYVFASKINDKTLALDAYRKAVLNDNLENHS